MPRGVVMAGFQRREKARDLVALLARLCVDAPAGAKANLKMAARAGHVSPARAWRVLEPLLYSRYQAKERARVEAYLASQRKPRLLVDCACFDGLFPTPIRDMSNMIDARPS